MAARLRRGPPAPWLLGSGLACMRNEQVIVRDINFTLHRGSAVVLTGPNASGKSSFLRLLCGFIKPSAGRLFWDGNDLSQAGLYDLYRPQVHLIAAKDAIKKAMTVYENVHFWEVLEGGEGRTQWALDKMGLGTIAQEKAVVLSMGQRKRLQLARMLAVPRPLWLLDEPSVGLDTEGVEILEDLMDEHRRKGGMVFVATHVPIKLHDAMHLMFPPRVPQLRQYNAGDYA
ncbi:hypothetical protein KC19_10G047300 [Ceratodon purpureus]|uniref:ABC transporter domain-containing protein n=1 Tax=Ceratodon purpureus TaxID=3225 RepID=A0A8T0GJD4_CERPU|nr:hypothetical protein KC19_10G047300 [Ceratodon purpureus]